MKHIIQQLKYLLVCVNVVCCNLLHAQAELNLLEKTQNRITINHVNGEKEIFQVSQKSINAKAGKLYHWYESQNVNITQAGYAGKLLDGDYTRYDNAKQLLIQGKYKLGLSDGIWKKWQPNQRLLTQESWKNGVLNGHVTHYDEQGKIMKSGKMLDAQWEGKVWTYIAADSSYRWFYYNFGKIITQEEYIQASILRRTGEFAKKLWRLVFHKKDKEELITH